MINLSQKKHSLLFFNPFEEENNNNEQMEKLKKYIPDIIDHELTERQRQIIILYYYEQKNMTEIAMYLRVNPSTVSRSLATSRKNIYRILKYYF